MKRGDGQVCFRTYLNLPSLEELSILPLRSHRGRSLAGTRKALWLLGTMPDVVDMQGLSSPSIVRFRIDEVGSICQWSALGLLIVVIFELFSNSILVLFSTKKCSNGGKNERE